MPNHCAILKSLINHPNEQVSRVALHNLANLSDSSETADALKELLPVMPDPNQAPVYVFNENVVPSEADRVYENELYRAGQVMEALASRGLISKTDVERAVRFFESGSLRVVGPSLSDLIEHLSAENVDNILKTCLLYTSDAADE